MLAVAVLLGTYALEASATARRLEGRVYVEGVVGEVHQLNPLAQTGDASPAERDIASHLFSGLTRIAPDGRVEPALAERWSADADGREWVFTLRPGALWHDGTAVTAGDVLYTIGAVQSPRFPGDPTLQAAWRGVRVRREDDRSVRFVLPSPSAAFPSMARLPILPAHLLAGVPPEQWADAGFALQPVGSGEFRLVALDPQQALLEPVDGNAAIDYLLLRLYPSSEAAREGLRRRDISGTATPATPGMQLVQPADPTDRSELPLGEVTLLAFNMRQAPLDNLEFRRALIQAINRDLLIENMLQGHGRRIETPVLPGTWAAGTAALPEYRRSAAQQALGRLGYAERNSRLERDGRPLVLPLLVADVVGQAELGNEIARQLAAIGVGIELRSVPLEELRARLAQHDFTLALHSWDNLGADPDSYALWHSSQANGGANYAGLDDARIDELLTRGLQTLDQAERRSIYVEFQRRWTELLPSLPLYQSVLLYDADAAALPFRPEARRDVE